MKNIAVVLCGSGYKDGSEIRESVGVLWALSQHPVAVQCFAPDAPQHDVVNCLSGRVAEGEKRNMLVEAARIARGQVLPLDQLAKTTGNYDGIFLPGGFGVAKNLCSFAFNGHKGTVRPELQKILDLMFQAGKPIGAVCIAPALIALAFKGKGLELTLGSAGDAAKELEKLGHRHIVCKANEYHLDPRHRVASTPAYMIDAAPLNEIFEGIQKMVAAVLQ